MMSNDSQFEKTIYRKWPNGEIIALFPQIASDEFGYYCESYIHVGQHGRAYPRLVVRQTKLATPSEYKDLDDELRGLGYIPIPAKRFTQKDFEIRKTQIEKIKGKTDE